MEEIAKQVTINVSHAVEILAGVIIGIGVIRLAIRFIMSVLFLRNDDKPLLPRGMGRPEALRIQFGSSVAVALELLLGADVLATAVAPSWNDIGQLAAIATIRTVLNYFLERELKHVKSAG